MFVCSELPFNPLPSSVLVSEMVAELREGGPPLSSTCKILFEIKQTFIHLLFLCFRHPIFFCCCWTNLPILALLLVGRMVFRRITFCCLFIGFYSNHEKLFGLLDLADVSVTFRYINRFFWGYFWTQKLWAQLQGIAHFYFFGCYHISVTVWRQGFVLCRRW